LVAPSDCTVGGEFVAGADSWSPFKALDAVFARSLAARVAGAAKELKSGLGPEEVSGAGDQRALNFACSREKVAGS